MRSNRILCRSWGLNRGEERFLGEAVGMVTLAGCGAECLFCYLADGDARPVAWGTAEFLAACRDLRSRGAACLYLVNPEGADPETLAEGLSRLRRVEPGFPVVLKLGGHEAMRLARRLARLVDAVSLDAKVFSEADGRDWLGIPDYPARLAAHLDFWAGRLGSFDPDAGQIAGMWLRHLVLPARAGSWGRGLAGMREAEGVPAWVSLEYRPFGPARTHPVLGARLGGPEREEARAVAESLRSEGRLVWVA